MNFGAVVIGQKKSQGDTQMNVLHLLSSGGIGGIETLCTEYAKYSLHKNIFVFLLGEQRTICEKMRKQGTPVYEINYSKVDIRRTFKALSRLCEEYKIDVIVEHHSSPILYLYILGLKYKYNFLHSVMYVHSNAADLIKGKGVGYNLRRIILQLGLRRADCVVAISNSVKMSILQTFGVKESKIKVIYNGVDVRKFTPQRRTNAKSEFPGLKIIYVGRLIREKGVQTILNELSYLDSSIIYKFLIVGDGNYRTELERIVKEKELKNNVSFLGTRNDVETLLQQCDVFVHMPIWEEGFGITIVEAMSTGLICICNDRGAIPEIIQNNVNGFLLDHRKKGELSKKLEELFSTYENEHWDTIRANAITTAKKYSIDGFSKALDELLECIIKVK